MTVEHRTPIYDFLSGTLRKRRNRELFSRLHSLRGQLGRELRVLDVGGVESFWLAAPSIDATLILLNTEEAFTQEYWFPGRLTARRIVGTALDIGEWQGEIDVVICNSVIEHVGRWDDMARCANELRSVAPAGWVQTPAMGFPIEPHYALPFVHWLSDPLKARIIGLLPHHSGTMVRQPDAGRRAAEENNLLTRREFRWLFPQAEVHSERLFGLTKSFVASWGFPDPTPPGNLR